jgi:hypothetical protein
MYLKGINMNNSPEHRLDKRFNKKGYFGRCWKKTKPSQIEKVVLSF